MLLDSFWDSVYEGGYHNPGKPYNIDDIALYRRDFCTVIRKAYLDRNIKLLLKLDECGVKLLYSPIADILLNDYPETKEKKEKAKYFMKKAVENNESLARFIYSFMLEEDGENEKAIEILKEALTANEDCEECEAALIRLQEKYGITMPVPPSVEEARRYRKKNLFDISAEHPYKLYPVRYFFWYGLLIVLAFLTFTQSLFFGILLAIAAWQFLGAKLSNVYMKPDDIRELKYREYAHLLALDYLEDSELGPVDLSDVKDYPDKGDYSDILWVSGGGLPLSVETVLRTDEYDHACFNYYYDVNETSKKIYFQRKENLIDRFFKGEKQLQPILEFMYYLRYDGEKLYSIIKDTDYDRLDNYYKIPLLEKRIFNSIYDVELANADTCYYPVKRPV